MKQAHTLEFLCLHTYMKYSTNNKQLLNIIKKLKLSDDVLYFVFGIKI